MVYQLFGGNWKCVRCWFIRYSFYVLYNRLLY